MMSHVSFAISITTHDIITAHHTSTTHLIHQFALMEFALMELAVMELAVMDSHSMTLQLTHCVSFKSH